MIRRRRNVDRVGATLMLALTLTLCAWAAARNQEPAGSWKLFSSLTLGSVEAVAWSPKGDRIAFISGGIWVAPVPQSGRSIKLRRLTRLKRKDDVPVGLFWLDDNHIGWAAAHCSERYPLTFSFMKMGLGDNRPKRLISRSFAGSQNRPAMESAYGAPDDVYYDACSHALLFSSGAMPSGAYVMVISVASGKARKLFVPDAYDSVPVTLCGSLRNPEKPQFYIATALRAKDWQIWRSDSYSLRQDEVLVTAPEDYLYFPRLSPDGKFLAYFSINDRTRGFAEIKLHDMKTGRERLLAAPTSQYTGDGPLAMGCPFSWSPDGKKIAYADGTRMKIVEVSGTSK